MRSRDIIPQPNHFINIKELDLSPREGHVLSCIDGKTSTVNLAQMCGVSQKELEQILKRLDYLDAIKYGNEGDINDDDAIFAGVVLNPYDLAEEVELSHKQKKRILALFSQLELIDYYQILGVKKYATEMEIYLGYKSALKYYDPESYRGRELGSYYEKMLAIIDYVKSAYDTLKYRPTRIKYDRKGIKQVHRRVAQQISTLREAQEEEPAASEKQPSATGQMLHNESDAPMTASPGQRASTPMKPLGINSGPPLPDLTNISAGNATMPNYGQTGGQASTSNYGLGGGGASTSNYGLGGGGASASNQGLGSGGGASIPNQGRSDSDSFPGAQQKRPAQPQQKVNFDAMTGNELLEFLNQGPASGISPFGVRRSDSTEAARIKENRGISDQRIREARRSYLSGLREFGDGNLESAANSFKLALVLDPNNEVYKETYQKFDPSNRSTMAIRLFETGKSEEEAGQKKAALKLYRKAIKIFPSNLRFYIRAVEVMLQIGNDIHDTRHMAITGARLAQRVSDKYELEAPEMVKLLEKVNQLAGIKTSIPHTFRKKMEAERVKAKETTSSEATTPAIEKIVEPAPIPEDDSPRSKRDRATQRYKKAMTFC